MQLLEESNELAHQIAVLQHRRLAITNQVEELMVVQRTGISIEESSKRHAPKRCSVAECPGYLDETWQCGLCNQRVCKHCWSFVNDGEACVGECNPDALATANFIRAQCRPCPRCDVYIEKSSGCNQMWCILCSTPFCWRTGLVLKLQHFENPEHTAQMQQQQARLGNQPDEDDSLTYDHFIEAITGPISGAVFHVVNEINDMRERIPPSLFNAIDAMRKLDNIIYFMRQKCELFGNTLDCSIKYMEGSITQEKWADILVKRHNELMKCQGVETMCTTAVAGVLEILKRAIHQVATVVAETNMEVTPTEDFLMVLDDREKAIALAGVERALKIYAAADAELVALFGVINEKGQFARIVHGVRTWTVDSFWKIIYTNRTD